MPKLIVGGLPLKNNRNTITLIFFATIYISVAGQTEKPTFQSLQQGLSHQLVKCILKDSKGYMWFGTKDGLNKYDGINMVIYENDPNDTNSISHNAVYSIAEDKYNNIWIGTLEGFNLYNREQDNFIRRDDLFEDVDNPADVFVKSICPDNRGQIWIGTIGEGLILYNVKNSKIFHYLHNNTDSLSLGSDYITCIVIDNKDNVWIGTRNGLDLFDHKTGNFKHFVHASTDQSSLSNDLVNSLVLDTQGNLWIGTMEGGLNKLVKGKDNFTFKHFQCSGNPNSLSSNSILALFDDKKDNLWIGTENGGLNCLNMNTYKISISRREEGSFNSLNSNTIWSLYVDDNDILWVGTYNKGINIWDKKFQRFEPYQKNISAENTLSDNDITDFAEDADGNLWIATDGGGICLFNPHTREFIKTIVNDNNSLETNAIVTIIHDSNENVWVGTWNGGVDRLNKNGIKIKNYKIEGFPKDGNNKVLSLYEDKHGSIWAGTNGSGLFLYNPASDEFDQITELGDPLLLPDIDYITSIFEDSYGNFWVATLYGLKILKKKDNCSLLFYRFLSTNNPGDISSNRVSVIFEDSNKNLWVGTEDNGLNLFNRQDSTFTAFQKQDGLPNNSINGILEDKAGNLWISTNKGITKFDPAAKTIRNYSKEDGLNSDQFYPNSCLKTRTGEFYFGGNNGFNVFYPENIKENILVPKVHLTDFKIFNKSVPIGTKDSPLKKHISLTHKITLPYNRNSFTIEFVALNYTRSFQNQYAYMLEGLESDWNYIGRRHAATYTFISSGTYIFMVKGSNNDGIWNNNPTTLEINILPPVWKTVWAYCFYILLFFSLLYVFIRLWAARAKQSQILELNKMKLQFFANMSHELRTPLSLILSPLEEIISLSTLQKGLRNKLLMIYKNACRLFKIVNELLDFNKAEDNKLNIIVQPGNIVKFLHEVYSFYSDEALKRRIEYKFVSSSDKISAWFDADKLEKIFLNLLSNAFKFTPDEGKIILKIEKPPQSDKAKKHLQKQTNELVKISIIDNGKGIPQKYIDKVFDRFFQVPEKDSAYRASTGIGLTLTKTLVELHHGKISVTSEEFKETCFTVVLPLGNSFFKKEEILPEIINKRSGSSKLPSLNNSEDFKIRNPQKNAPVILIVEDNFELQQYMVSRFSGTYKVLEARDAESGLKLAVEYIPDLVISDIIMPNMSGIELCKNIKENILTSHIPVVLLTAKVTLEDKIKGVQTGADAYITKPFNFHYLEATINNLIKTRHRLFQRFSQEAYMLPRELSKNKLDQNFLENIIGYIEDNITNENLSVENLASHLLMSRGHTWRKIKSLTGQSANRFIRIIRLKKAIKLMEEGELNISEITFKVGFTSPPYFTKCFKEEYGKTPSEFIADFVKKKKGFEI